jgi:hypothetical protein
LYRDEKMECFSLCFLIFLWNNLSGESKESGIARIE